MTISQSPSGLVSPKNHSARAKVLQTGTFEQIGIKIHLTDCGWLRLFIRLFHSRSMSRLPEMLVN